MRAGAPPLPGDIPHRWVGQRPTFDGEDTVAAMPAIRQAEPPPPLFSEQPTQSYPPTQVSGPPAYAPPVQVPRPVPQPVQQAQAYGYIDPETGLPPIPSTGQPAYQDRYLPRTYRPPARSGPPRRGLSLTWVIGAGFLAVALTAIMVLALGNPFGWELPFLGGREEGPGQAADATTPAPTLTPTLMSAQPVQPPATPSPTATTQPIAPVGMVMVEGGAFTRGVTNDEANTAAYDCINASNEYLDSNMTLCIPDYFTDAQPVEEITLYPFFIDVTEVTNSAYAGCVAAGACEPPSDTVAFDDPALAQHPVVHVTWAQAQAYCVWRGGRLPTEAEWEKTARGTTPRVYPWGDEWTAGIANLIDSGLGGTSIVRAFPQDVSPYGVFDMAGNVSEWVADWYFEDYTGFGALAPIGPDRQPYDEAMRVARGGSYADIYPFARTGHRLAVNTDLDGAWLGFRCAMDVTGTSPAEESPTDATATPTPTVTPTVTAAATATATATATEAAQP